MLKNKIFISFFMLIALLVPLSVLIWLNWSPEIRDQFWTSLIIGSVSFFTFVLFNQNSGIWAQFWNGFIIGTVSLITFVLFSLKEIKLPEESFPAQVVMNERFHQPISLDFNSFDPLLETRYLTLEGLASNPFIKKPENPDQTTTFLLDLLQYKIISDMTKFQNVKSETDQIVPINSITNIKPTVFAPYKPDDLRLMNSKEYLKAVSENPFSKEIIQNEMQPNFWNTFGLWLPKRSKLFLRSTVSSDGVEQRNIFITKHEYFNIEITIEPLVYGNLYSISPKLVNDPEMANNCRTYNFVIKMNATFEKFRSRSFKTEQYIKWAQWLFNEIERVNTDKQSEPAVNS